MKLGEIENTEFMVDSRNNIHLGNLMDATSF